MVKIKYDIDIMKYMSLFESLSGAKVKDCIVNDVIFFIVHENEMGKAIGKQGSNIKRVENTLKKKIKLAEFNNDVSQFIQNLIYPLKAKEIKEEEGVVTIYVDDRKTKGMLIGRDRHNINSIKDIVKRYFKVEEIKVA
ncbi:MAG TPA: NusA-like transcription termination signal-binding factor [Candidatus Woesearchaeota archaeon]|nr:NusA-like transcription termination signal-binding factor [Candidatus Woesearchaeota archaeon]MDP7322438.1 NusA-like transcription termination signal-binding factor [Candidatus Woesearchaeota archaeon]HJO01478.1 NusA-like transcription termination signal-binding factor [Candidatus Woesearchaeota archaeon]